MSASNNKRKSCTSNAVKDPCPGLQEVVGATGRKARGWLNKAEIGTPFKVRMQHKLHCSVQAAFVNFRGGRRALSLVLRVQRT